MIPRTPFQSTIDTWRFPAREKVERADTIYTWLIEALAICGR
jgi:hypothetical protein